MIKKMKKTIFLLMLPLAFGSCSDAQSGESSDLVNVTGLIKNLNGSGPHQVKVPAGEISNDTLFTLAKELESNPKANVELDLSKTYGLINIHGGHFYNCSNLVKIILPNSVEHLNSGAFTCTGLKEIVLPESLKKINTGAFFNCTALEKITFPNSVEEIEIGAFIGCINLAKVENMDNIKKISEAAFYGCIKLNNVKISSQTQYIGGGVFQDCISLTTLQLDNNPNYKIENQLILSKDGKDLIGVYGYLNKVTIPNSVKTVKKAAFYKNQTINSINIPKSVTSIEKNAFSECKNTTIINYEGSESDWKKINISAENNTILSNSGNLKYNVSF